LVPQGFHHGYHGRVSVSVSSVESVPHTVQQRVEFRGFREFGPICSEFQPCRSIGRFDRFMGVQLTFLGLTAVSLCGCFSVHGIIQALPVLGRLDGE